ncbi:MAG: hypothetical protein NC926_01395 [Candidatus Omnitrophica bacterium]|nr:hypothetical protein [Candidatus Omnitrophota bacterium]
MKRIIFLFLLFSLISFAHKINIFTYKEGEKIYVESYFPDGKPVKKGKIEVYNENGEKIIEGQTDENGVFSFNIPENKKIKIILTGDAGHKTETFMELVKEIKKEGSNFKKETFKSMELDKEEIKKILEEVLEKKMNEFLKEYRKEREKEKFKDIVGGIGYILGIFGIYLYFRKK